MDFTLEENKKLKDRLFELSNSEDMGAAGNAVQLLVQLSIHAADNLLLAEKEKPHR